MTGDRLNVSFAPSEINTSTGEFNGYGAVFGTLDSHADIIQPGAFRASLADWRLRGRWPRMLLMHGTSINPFSGSDIPIGKWSKMEEDRNGLYVEGRILALETDYGKRILSLMKGGALDAPALDAGTVTVAQIADSLKKVWDYIRANGATDAQFLVSPVGANDFTVERGYTGSRAAVLAAISDASAYANLGVDYYDMPRFMGQVHLMDIGYAAWGYREAKAYANLEHAQSNNLGPTITGVTLSANGKVATITFSKTGSLFIPSGTLSPATVSGGTVQGPYPMGFGIVPGSNQAGTPVASARAYISGADIKLECDTTMVGKRIIYPYGHFPEHRLSQFMRDYQSDTYHGIPGLPMRAYDSGVLS